jgi:hypothetical protein
MASGHVNRINRPNTWLHRQSLRREDSSCQPGAVHTWHIGTGMCERGLSKDDPDRAGLGVRDATKLTVIHVFANKTRAARSDLERVAPPTRIAILPTYPPYEAVQRAALYDISLCLTWTGLAVIAANLHS